MLERSADFKTGVNHVNIEHIYHILHWGQSNMRGIYGCNKGIFRNDFWKSWRGFFRGEGGFYVTENILRMTKSFLSIYN